MARQCLRPLAQHAHQNNTRHQRKEGKRRTQKACIAQLAVHPVMRPHAHETRPDQDAGGKGIKSANGDDGALVIAVEMI